MLSTPSGVRSIVRHMNRKRKSQDYAVPLPTIVSIAYVCAVLAGVIAGIVFQFEVSDWITAAVGAGALTVSLLAWNTSAKAQGDSTRAADAAELSAETARLEADNRKYGWSITPDPRTNIHLLRNTGSADANDVELSRIGVESDVASPARPRFLNDAAGKLIRAGESREFFCVNTFGDRLTEIQIDWTPKGELAPRHWVEATSFTDHECRERTRQERHERDVRGEDQRRSDSRYFIDLLIRLGEAYADYRVDPDDPRKRFQVQMLAAALPPNLAIEAGFEVDVAKNAYKSEMPHDWFVPDEDKHFVEGRIAEIEILWDIAGFGPPVLHANEHEPPEYTLRHAVEAYAARARKRTEGVRETRWTEADQAEHDAIFASMKARSAARGRSEEPTSPDEPSEN